MAALEWWWTVNRRSYQDSQDVGYYSALEMMLQTSTRVSSISGVDTVYSAWMIDAVSVMGWLLVRIVEPVWKQQIHRTCVSRGLNPQFPLRSFPKGLWTAWSLFHCQESVVWMPWASCHTHTRTHTHVHTQTHPHKTKQKNCSPNIVIIEPQPTVCVGDCKGSH